MGRVSKYLTHDERVKAAKDRKADYNQTTRCVANLYGLFMCSYMTCRAKILRREQNRRAYQTRTQHKSRLTPTWSTVPRAIRDQGSTPLPVLSNFFKTEFRSRQQVSDDDALASWDYYPPYHSSGESNRTLSVIIERAHGRRLREQYQSESLRLQRFNDGTDDDILTEIDRDINTYLTSWNELDAILRAPSSDQMAHIDLIMGKHLLQWKARRVVDLLADWKAAKKGRSKQAFKVLFSNRWSQY